VRGGWFAKRKSSTGVEGLEIAKLPGKALPMGRSVPDRRCGYGTPTRRRRFVML